MLTNLYQTKVSASKALLDAKMHLESTAILHLEEMMQRTRFYEEVIRDMYAGQVAIVQGGESTNGITQRLEALRDRQKQLSGRIKSLAEKLQEQKGLANGALSMMISQQTAVTQGERIYRSQLENWSSTVSRLQDTLRSLTRVSKAGKTPATLSPAAKRIAMLSPNANYRGSKMSTPSGKIALSDEEISSCVQLLGSEVSRVFENSMTRVGRNAGESDWNSIGIGEKDSESRE